MRTGQQWIESLSLQPHPEGGWFRETYRCPETVARAALPTRFDGDRSFHTAIYYLLQGGEFSAFHRIRQDEGWHLYAGSPLTLHLIAPDGAYTARVLGWRPEAGEEPQAVVPAGWLFAATVNDPSSYALAGCTVAPGFDFADFTLPTRAELLAAYPQHTALIERLTRA